METAQVVEHQAPTEEDLIRLKQQIMISQVSTGTGCTPDQSLSLLTAANWDCEMAMSLFFQEVAPAQQNLGPANTPATPNLLPDALSAFAALQASSPKDTSSSTRLNPADHVSTVQQQSSNPFWRSNN